MTLLSPGVQVKERDLSQIIPTVSSGIGAIAGRFTKGPILNPILISSEEELVSVFGKPNDTLNNANEWFTASEFLKYTNKLWVVRAQPSGALNATDDSAGVAVPNSTSFSSQTFPSTTRFISRDQGTAGNSIAVILVDNSTWNAFETWSINNASMFPNNIPLSQYFSSKPTTSAFVMNKTTDQVDRLDEVHVLVVDIDGRYSSDVPYTVLEKYEGLSKAMDAVDFKGNTIYYSNVINNLSAYVWQGINSSGTPNHPIQVTTASTVNFGSLSFDVAVVGKTFSSIDVTGFSNGFWMKTLANGVNGSAPDLAAIQTAYDQFKNKDLYDVNLMLTGAFNFGTTYGTQVPQYVVSNVVMERGDCIAFVSPCKNDGTPFRDIDVGVLNQVIGFKTDPTNGLNIAESYASYYVLDTGFKWIYDRYNQKFRWVPLNGDVAGLCARTDDTNDPWWSPAGFNRGGIKNVTKLAFNPNNAQRDILYPKGINPVVAFPGQGVLLFGDRTATLKSSAFDRINVRRLFLILEKAISTAAKYQLFEFNDSFTRAQFRNMVEPYLRNIQGRRGIIDFKVVCDETNNTGEVIDRNEFVAEIYVKPNRSINFITLSFVATRTDVSFSQVIGS